MIVTDFSSTGISLNQILGKLGIVTTEDAGGGKSLTYNGKTIPRPSHNKCEEILLEQFGISIV